ncbi:uncharacterized protein LOC115751008 isoform X3 [Rhodamnia argentea]|uniref:Uncharacterized protein LOC115751008 isoform X3 n=1 Tax=Rhodamnia argentea TaxID=178133 RepID=A0A8B8QEA5_9MYRT|nr:uncharacterized protein LOC115751008 isoform X3 [Rhodamnia argentea]
MLIMGKRKRTDDRLDTDPSLSSSSPAESMPCSSGVELSSRKKSSHFVDSNEMKPFTSSMEMDTSSNHSSPLHLRQNLGRSMFLKRSRNWYGHQNSWRNSGAHMSATTSHGKTPPSWEERLNFKLASRYNSDNWQYADYRDRAFNRPERIRSDSATLDSASLETAKLQCGVCQKLLRRKPYLLSGSHSSSENSVVAVLVCGHVYHADCLEQKTALEDKSDPLCPICLNLLSPADAFKGGGGQ